MKPLKFTSRVLGPNAVKILKARKLTQTIRSPRAIVPYRVGDSVQITLNGKPVGKAVIQSIRRIRLSKLTTRDARLGGFASRSDLYAALNRTPYRLHRHHFHKIHAYKVRFTWD